VRRNDLSDAVRNKTTMREPELALATK
jgi:hypothetical protein